MKTGCVLSGCDGSASLVAGVSEPGSQDTGVVINASRGDQGQTSLMAIDYVPRRCHLWCMVMSQLVGSPGDWNAVGVEPGRRDEMDVEERFETARNIRDWTIGLVET